MPTCSEIQETIGRSCAARHGTSRRRSLTTSRSRLPSPRSSFWTNIKSKLVIAGVVLPAIGLVVGAIVIMNIMLVAVAERTREIGIRKALGARRRDIMSQFLVEAATLSTVGAALGIGIGILLAQIIAAVSPLPGDGRALVDRRRCDRGRRSWNHLRHLSRRAARRGSTRFAR